MENKPTVETTAEQQQDLAALTAMAEEEQTPGQEPEPQPEQPDIPTDKIVLMIISPLCDIFAPGWKITEKEKGMLAAAYAPVIDKYFPDLDLGPEIGAIAVTAMIFGARKDMPRKLEKPAKEEGKTGED